MLLSICLLQINHVCPNLHTPVQLFAFNMRVHVFMCLFVCVCELKHFHLFSFLFFAIAPELDSFSHLRFIESSVAVLTRRNHNKRNCFYLWPRKKYFPFFQINLIEDPFRAFDFSTCTNMEEMIRLHLKTIEERKRSAICLSNRKTKTFKTNCINYADKIIQLQISKLFASLIMIYTWYWMRL